MKRMLALVASLSALWASSAPASVLVTLDSITPEGGGIYEWIYRASLQPEQTLRTNDFFTLYDVGGVIASANFGANNASQQSSFNVTEQAIGINPGSTNPPETGLPNFTVHYTGANIVPTAGSGAITLGNLVIRSTTNQSTSSFYAAQSLVTGGNQIVNGAPVSVPVPEPGSVAMLIAGLAAVGGLAFRRKTFG